MPRVCQKQKQREVTWGWLRNNYGLVTGFEVFDVRGRIGPHPFTSCKRCDGIFIAYLRTPGEWFMAPISDRRWLRSFLLRPIFRGKPVNWYGKVGSIYKSFFKENS